MCDLQTEKAPNPSCQENLPSTSLLSLIQRDELRLMWYIRSEGLCLGFMLISRWRWSATPLIMYNLCHCWDIIPLIYLYKPSSHSLLIRDNRFWTAKTKCMYSWVYVFAIFIID
jgi:hypothetical protein